MTIHRLNRLSVALVLIVAVSAVSQPLARAASGHTDSGAVESPSDTNVSEQPRQPVFRYRLYEDVTEKAFTVLVPDGWRTEGGIMQIPASQIQTVVDGCGKKLYFSIHDPASQVSITYFPTDIFHTAIAGGMQVWPGQVLNGMIQMPVVPSPAQYVSEYLFPSARQDARHVQWQNRQSLTALADAWHRAFHPDDPGTTRVEAESVEVSYERSGTRFAELWTALITRTQLHTSVIWLPDFAVAAGGPAAIVEDYAPVLEAVITSFRINPAWMADMIASFDACTKQVAKTQQRVRDLEQSIAKRVMQVQQEIRNIDNDIVTHRDQTRSVIQEHEHNVLMGKDKYEDSATGTRYLIDMGYARNFTDGDIIIQTDDQLFEPPPGFRDMNNISITGD